MANQRNIIVPQAHTVLLVFIFVGTNFRGDRTDYTSRVLIFADLSNQNLSPVLILQIVNENSLLTI